MLECLVMGDSIAVGIGQHRPDCVVAAKVGITSKKWFFTYHETITNNKYKNVYISLGSNDNWNATADALYAIRKTIKADRVYWVLTSPTLKPHQRVIIREIASEFRDATVDISEHISRDGIHPTGAGYKAIANKLRSNI